MIHFGMQSYTLFPKRLIVTISCSHNFKPIVIKKIIKLTQCCALPSIYHILYMCKHYLCTGYASLPEESISLIYTHYRNIYLILEWIFIITDLLC